MSQEIILNEFVLSSQNRPYFIADIGANHDGDIERALQLIQLAKKAGADAAKFQNFTADKIVSKKQFDSNTEKKSHQSTWKKSVYEVYKDASISQQWTERLYEKCKSIGIEYLTTPYDFNSLEHVDPFLNFYKIGSGDISWIDFIEAVAKKNKPIILSSGASDIDDVKRAINAINKIHNKIVLLQCNTNYTASDENYDFINLNVLTTYKRLFPDIQYGLSDHTYGSETVLGAIALGARVIEKHFTDDNTRVGPDHKFAMNPVTFRQMVDSSMRVWRALGTSEKNVTENEKESYFIQRRSLYAAKDLSKGETLKEGDLIPLRPIVSEGIEPFNKNKVIGKVIQRDIKIGDPIRIGDVFDEKGQ